MNGFIEGGSGSGAQRFGVRARWYSIACLFGYCCDISVVNELSRAMIYIFVLISRDERVFSGKGIPTEVLATLRSSLPRFEAFKFLNFPFFQQYSAKMI